MSRSEYVGEQITASEADPSMGTDESGNMPGGNGLGVFDESVEDIWVSILGVLESEENAE